MEQRYSLANHVRSHQCTVSIVVLEEWNQRCSDRCYLLWRYIHQVNISRWNYREVSILTALNNRTDKCTIIIQRCITLTESMFGFKGMGLLLYNATRTADYDMIMFLQVIYTFLGLFSNLVIDLCYGIVDPRVRISK